MRTVTRTGETPPTSTVGSDFADYHYCDSFRIRTTSSGTIDQITTDIFRTPRWADALMTVRNRSFRLLGLDPGGFKKDIHVSDFYPVGSKAVYFTVIERRDDELVMAESDRHLDFRISVLATGTAGNVDVSLTTLVRYHNRLGRFYFSVVRPFHRLIVISLLKGLLKNPRPMVGATAGGETPEPVETPRRR